MPVRRGFFFARFDEYFVALLNVRPFHIFHIPVFFDAMGGVGHELGEFLQGVGRTQNGPHFDPMSQEHNINQRDQSKKASRYR